MIRLTRSMLFVPGSRPDMIEKAVSRGGADAICLDLEDSVSADEKAASRGHVVRALQQHEFGRRIRMVRINALDTPFAYRDVIEVVEAVGDRLDLLMVPKVSSPADVAFVDTLLTQIEGFRGWSRRVGVEAQIENARGFLYAREIASASPRLEALIFGPGDYSASMQMPSSGVGEFDEHDALYPGHRWHAVMHTIVASARANGLRCMDGPYASYKDAAGFERSCRMARAMGFDGKQCIHPSQLAVANTVFAPSDDEVAKASAVVKAYDAAVAGGQGAAGHGGQMIDMASIRMARTVLERKKLADAAS
jgi:malyl-CoA/(S)-citramalyl-CoA lyase